MQYITELLHAIIDFLLIRGRVLLQFTITVTITVQVRLVFYSNIKEGGAPRGRLQFFITCN